VTGRSEVGRIVIGGSEVGLIVIGGSEVGLIVIGGSEVGVMVTGGSEVGLIVIGGSEVGLIVIGGSEVGWIVIGGSEVGLTVTGGSEVGWMVIGGSDVGLTVTGGSEVGRRVRRELQVEIKVLGVYDAGFCSAEFGTPSNGLEVFEYPRKLPWFTTGLPFQLWTGVAACLGIDGDVSPLKLGVTSGWKPVFVNSDVDSLGMAVLVIGSSGSSCGGCWRLAWAVFDGDGCTTPGEGFTTLVPVGSDRLNHPGENGHAVWGVETDTTVALVTFGWNVQMNGAQVTHAGGGGWGGTTTGLGGGMIVLGVGEGLAVTGLNSGLW
jgi:hypothetical protein